MTVASVANHLGKSQAEVDAYKDKDIEVIAQDLALSVREATLLGGLGTPITVPGAPTGVVAAVTSPTKVSVSFVQTVSGGADVDSWTVTSSPGGFAASGVKSPIVVDAAFVTAQAYTFRVKATNEVGTSADSVASNVVTPKP